MPAIALTPHRVFGERPASLCKGIRPFSRVYVAIGIDGNAFAHRALIYAVLPIEWQGESCNPIFVNRTDPNAVAPIRVVVWSESESITYTVSALMKNRLARS
jgi:hypothetical protein